MLMANLIKKIALESHANNGHTIFMDELCPNPIEPKKPLSRKHSVWSRSVRYSKSFNLRPMRKNQILKTEEVTIQSDSRPVSFLPARFDAAELTLLRRDQTDRYEYLAGTPSSEQTFMSRWSDESGPTLRNVSPRESSSDHDDSMVYPEPILQKIP
jgi:hypothetical protein